MNHLKQEKTILVTGATGMIGTQIIKALTEWENIKIIALYRNEIKKDKVFSRERTNPRIHWICQDICTPLEYSGNIDCIIHTAGVTGGSRQHIDYPMRTITTALNGTINMLELAKDKKCESFVYLSSLEVYGKTDFELPSISESDGGYLDSMCVRSSYSESKRMCETICASYAKQFHVPAKVVRLTATYGAGADYEDKRVLCEFARDIIEGKDIILKSLGDTVRNYCDVSDAVEGILKVMECGASGEAYNIANMDTEISIKELAERFIFLYPESGSSLKFDLPDDVTALGYNPTIKIRLDARKLENLGWKAKVGIDGMIENLVEAMKKAKEKEKNNG